MLPGHDTSQIKRSAAREFRYAAQVDYIMQVIQRVDAIRARKSASSQSGAMLFATAREGPDDQHNDPAGDAAGAGEAGEPSKIPLLIGPESGADRGARTKVNHPAKRKPRSRVGLVNDYTSPMPVPRLRIDEAALLVIDMQEKLLPTITDAERVTHNCASLLRVAEILGMPYLITEQYPTGLGRTVEAVTGAMEDQSRRIEKTRFSAGVDIVMEQLHAWRRPSTIICGIEAHVCVLQTVLDLQASGRQCFVCLDAVSAGQREQVPWALRRMERAGAVITGVLSAVFEMLTDSAHPSFKACLELMKDLKQ